MKVVAPGVWKLQLGEPEKITPVRMRETGILTWEMAKLPAAGDLPLVKSDFQFKVTSRGCIVEHPLGANEMIYGFGLQLKSHNQKGRKKHLRVNSDPAADTGDSHAPVPFYVSTRGYGILVDTARYASFYCGTHRKADGAGTAETQRTPLAGSTEELYSVKESAGTMNMVIDIPSARGVDIYIFAGPDMKQAVQRYNLFSGGGCLPPCWGLGVWYRAYGKMDMEGVINLATMLRDTGMPCNVFGLEPGWQSYTYPCSYTWDSQRFSKPDRVIQALQDMGYKINLWEHVFVHPKAPIYNQLQQYAGDYEVWGGLVPDLSIPEVRSIFARHHKEYLVQTGIAGFKLDECDNSDFVSSPWSFPEFSSFPSGIDGEQMHCLLGTLYQSTIQSVFRDMNMRTYCQVRSSHELAAPLPFVLYSDLYDHRDFIRGLVNMGFSGLLWSPEVRGCASVEDLIRRVQSVVFSPQALVNAWMIKNPPWWQVDGEKNNNDELMSNYKQAENACRKLFELRMSLIPYLYASFARYRFEGLPPFRALVMDCPADKNTYEIDDEYLMGDSLLVAPVVAGDEKRNVYLPAGNWYCLWTHDRYEGEHTYDIQVDLDRIPVFVKENTLLPLARPVTHITPGECFEITVYRFGQSGKFTLYEDDGVTFDFEKGMFNTVELTWKQGSKPSIRRKGQYGGRMYKVVDWKSISG